MPLGCRNLYDAFGVSGKNLKETQSFRASVDEKPETKK